jgi:hypothetical protein
VDVAHNVQHQSFADGNQVSVDPVDHVCHNRKFPVTVQSGYLWSMNHSEASLPDSLL